MQFCTLSGIHMHMWILMLLPSKFSLSTQRAPARPH